MWRLRNDGQRRRGFLAVIALACAHACCANAAPATESDSATARDVAFVDSGDSFTRAVATGVMHIVVTVDIDLSKSIQNGGGVRGLTVLETTRSIRVRRYFQLIIQPCWQVTGSTDRAVATSLSERPRSSLPNHRCALINQPLVPLLQGSCAMARSGSNLLVPTAPCQLIVPGQFLDLSGAGAMHLWLDNLNIRVVTPDRDDAAAALLLPADSRPAALALADAQLWLTNMQLLGGGSTALAARMTSSHLFALGASRDCVLLTHAVCCVVRCEAWQQRGAYAHLSCSA